MFKMVLLDLLYYQVQGKCDYGYVKSGFSDLDRESLYIFKDYENEDVFLFFFSIV